MAIPLSPEEEARVAAYYAGQPGVTMSDAGASPPADDPYTTYYGPPPPPASLVSATPMPAETVPPPAPPPPQPAAPAPPDPASLLGTPGVNMSVDPVPPGFEGTPGVNMSGGAKVRQPVAFERTTPAAPAARRGGPANPDPYGQKGATQRLLGTYDAEADAIRRGAVAEGDRAYTVAEMRREFARRKEEDAAIASAEQDEAAKHFDSQMSELRTQLDDVRAKKIRPMSYIEAAGDLGGFGAIAAALSGFAAGLQGRGGNPYLEHLDRVIDRQLAADERNIDNEKATIGQKMNLLSQQRQVWNDREQAKAATRLMYYEGFEQEILAEAAKYDNPIAQANAEKAVAEIQRGKAALEKQLADGAAKAAAAAAAQRTAQAKEVQQAYRETYDKALAAGLSPAQAEEEAKRMVGILYAPGTVGARGPTPAGASPIGAVPKNLQTEAAKEWTGYAGAQQAKQSLRQAFSNFERAGVVGGGRDAFKAQIRGIIKPHMKGANSDADLEQLIEPFVPSTGEGDVARQRKLQAVQALIDSSATTPILDTHSPGWRQPTTAEADAELGAKPVGR